VTESHVSLAIAIADPRLRDAVYHALTGAPVRLLGDLSEFRDAGELASEIARARPELLLLGIPGLPVDYAEAIRVLRAMPDAPRVIAVNDAAEPESILGSMRAGASEYLYPPFADEFTAALGRVFAECTAARESARPGGAIVGFVSAKGGCGATTLACHAAVHLHRAASRRVLVADLDLSAGLAALYLNANPRYTVADALENLHRLDLTLWKALATRTLDGVDLIAGVPDPVEFSHQTRAFQTLLRFWRSQYDFTVVDFGRGLTPALFGLLESLDQLVLVTTGDPAALRMTRHLMRAVDRANCGPNRLRLAVNLVPRRPAFPIAEIERLMDYPVLGAIPQDLDAQPRDAVEVRPVQLDSALGAAVAAMTSKLAGISPPEPKKTRKLSFFNPIRDREGAVAR